MLQGFDCVPTAGQRSFSPLSFRFHVGFLRVVRRNGWIEDENPPDRRIVVDKLEALKKRIGLLLPLFGGTDGNDGSGVAHALATNHVRPVGYRQEDHGSAEPP